MARYELDFDEVRAYIEASSEITSIYIGCDSQVHRKRGKTRVSYARTIMVHKDSSNGCHLFGGVIVLDESGDMHQRLMKETEISIAVYEEIFLAIGNRHVEIHLDVNPDAKYKSSSVLSAATGWVRGVTGITPKVKPEAFAASHAADREAKRTKR